MGSRTLARGVAWIGAARWSSQLLTWAATLLVVRILSPQDYGLVGMTTFFVTLASVLAESGIGSAVLALRELTPLAMRQLHAVAIWAGFLAWFLAIGAAWPASWYFNDPALIPVMIVLGISFALDGLRIVPLALINRELDYRGSASVDLIRAVVAAATTLALALAGTHYWALVGGPLAGSAAATLATLRLRRLSPARPRRSELAGALDYCRHLVLGRLAYSAYQSADFMIAGRLFGSGPLGQYNLAWTIASLPGEKLTTVIIGATTPFFAAIQHDRKALAGYYLRLTRFLSLVLWPVFFGLLTVADLAIPLLLGDKWAPAVPLTRALLFYTAFLSIGLNNVVLNVTGQSRSTMQLAFLALVVMPPAFFIGGKLAGIGGVAWAWAVAFPIVYVSTLARGLAALQLSLRTYLAALARPALMVGIMVGGVLLLRSLLSAEVPRSLELGLAVLTGGVVYGGLCLVLARDDIAAVLRMRRSEG